MGKSEFLSALSNVADNLSKNKAEVVQGSTYTMQPLSVSDERLKKVFGENCPIECFSRVHSYVFKYKPEVQKAFGGQAGIDNDVHYGVMAQELEENPFTRSTVHTDPATGIKTVDTQELTMANTAAISDIMKELLELRAFKERVLSVLGGK